MILSDLKRSISSCDAVSREFIALMNGSFRYYSDTRSLFFGRIPAHLHQSELISLVNVEIKSRLFDRKFCDTIQDSLKSIRRSSLRLEDLRARHVEIPDQIHNLARLAELAEKIENLYQKHWEYYRYQERLKEDDIVGFLLEIDQLAYEWDIFLSGFSSIRRLGETLSGPMVPDHFVPMELSYQREDSHAFSVETLDSLLGFLSEGYRFVCQVCEIDQALYPLTMLQLSMGRPVEIMLGVAEKTREPFRRFLEYLFLKDMLKREALLKVVLEAIAREQARENGTAKPLTSAALTAFQKAIGAKLKSLPETSRFTISGRNFPDDSMQVLQEFTASLDASKIKYDALLRSGAATTPKRPSSAVSQTPAPSAPKQDPLAPQGHSGGSNGDHGAMPGPKKAREYIAVLTDPVPPGQNKPGFKP